MVYLYDGQYLGPNLVSTLLRHEEASDVAGKGLVAKIHIPKNTFLVAFGGTVMTNEEYSSLPICKEDLAIQVDNNLFLGPKDEESVTFGDHVNHSCDPNCGIFGSNYLVSRREIFPGEEVCFDYSMSDIIYLIDECKCNTPICRTETRTDDLKMPELVDRYRLHISTYLLRKIEDGLKIKFYDGITKDNPDFVFNNRLFREEVQLGSQIKDLERYYKK